MSVALTVSETFSGSAVNDSLAGGGSGVDLGPVANGAYAPIISKPANTGHQNIYTRHDATIDPITNFKLFLQQFGVGTGFTYGGANSAAADFASLKALGFASGNSKNNSNNLSGGIWVEMQGFDVADADAFDQASRPTLVKIFGDNNTDGIDLASAFTVKAEGMVYDNTGETLASSPEDGKIGKSGDTVLGDQNHTRWRVYLPSSYANGGIVQWEMVFAYSYTA